MATPIWLTGFEHGIYSLNGGGLFNSVSGSGTPSVVTTKKNTGSYALKIVSASDYAYVIKTVSGSPTTLVYRFYFHFDTSFPAVNVEIFSASLASGSWLSVYFDQATSKIGVGRQSGTVGGTPRLSSSTISVNTWYYVDVKAVVTGGTFTMDWYLNGVAQSQYTETIAATSFIDVAIGPDASNTSTIYYDDVVLSVTAGDFPIGAGGTEALLPTSDGSHNAGTNIMENQAGSDIGAVAAWSLIDDIPMSTATEYIRQLANGTGNYAEVQFANIAAVHNAIIGAMGVLAYTAASTSGNNGGCIMSKDDFSTQTVVWGVAGALADYSDGSLTDLYYKSVILANVNNDTTVNALEARMGYSGDANPDPYWINLIAEVAYTVAAGPVIPVFMNQYRQRSN